MNIVRSLLLLILCIGLVDSSRAEEVTWEMATKNADIHEFIAQVAKITGKTFIVDPRLKGQVTVISNTPLGKQGVYELFLSVLRLQNYTAVPSGSVIRIQQSATGKQSPGAQGGLTNAAPEELVTEIIPVQYVRSEELLKVLRPLIPQYGHIGSIVFPNAVIISDHADNIRRLKQVIRDLDIADQMETTMIALEHAWVGDVIAILEKVAPEQIGGNAKGPQRIQVIANERTNALVLRGKRSPIEEVIAIVKQLDLPATATDSTQVILLDHADAENLSKILTTIVGGPGAKTEGGGPSTIQADTSLNALVVKANPGLMNKILELVQELDTRRKQVLIEAAIVEVSQEVTQRSGVEMAAVDQNGRKVPLSTTSTQGVIGTILSSLATTSEGGDQQVLKGLAQLTSPTLAVAQVSAGGISFGAVVTALAKNSDTNLLSTPSVMTLDNQEAKILVGREVPFRTGSFTTTGDGSSNPFTTVTRKDVGAELTVTPHVFDEKEVRLEVLQVITNVVNTPVGGSAFADVVTSKRTIETTVLATGGETIVLGGLMQDDVSKNNTRLPLLGDIPVVGRLFSSRDQKRVKTNLLVFLKPSVLSTSEAATEISNGKREKIWEAFSIERRELDDSLESPGNDFFSQQ